MSRGWGEGILMFSCCASRRAIMGADYVALAPAHGEPENTTPLAVRRSLAAVAFVLARVCCIFGLPC